jgi:hypothetical protein
MKEFVIRKAQVHLIDQNLLVKFWVIRKPQRTPPKKLKTNMNSKIQVTTTLHSGDMISFRKYAT